MPQLPVAGFFRRVFAFVVDLIVLLLGIRILSQTFVGSVLSLGPAYPYMTGTLFVLYFILFNGPFGNGRTVGKILMGIQVTNLQGTPPTYGQSLIRTVVVLPAFFIHPLFELFAGEISSLKETFAWQLLVPFPLIAVLLANCLVIPFNPFKQGMHDYLARTLVRPYQKDEVGPRTSFETMTAQVGTGWLKFHRQPQISGTITFGMIYILLAFLFYPGKAPEEYQKIRENTYALNSVEGFSKARIWPFPHREEDYVRLAPVEPAESGEQFDMEEFLPSSDGLTTETVQLVIEVSRNADWPFDPTNDAYRSYTMELLERYYSEVFPFVIRSLNERSYEQSKELANNWNSRPVELNMVFIREARSAPPIYLLRHPVTSINKVFPAHNLSLPTESDENTQEVN